MNEFKYNAKNSSLNLISNRKNELYNYINTIDELANGNLIIGGYDKKIKFYEL